jgi:hypothetical protein
MDIKQEAPFW